jgi:dCTP deaminase
LGVLSRTEIEKLLEERLLIIESLVPNQPFDPKKQITEEAIDLRLGHTGLRYRDSITQIDTLFEKNLESCFETVEIPTNGYTLQPGQVLFASTLELVCLATKKYVGRILGRSTFARYGLSVHCTQPKLSAGVSSAFPLQLINHNNFPIIVYPSCYIVQLMIETTSGSAVRYEGKYDADMSPRPPKINPRELEPIESAEAIKVVKETASETSEHLRVIEKKVEEFQKRDREVPSKPTLSRKKTDTLKEILFGAASAAFFGFFGSIISSPEVSYWKTISACLTALLGFVFLGLLISYKLSS